MKQVRGNYLAHTPGNSGREDPLHSHLNDVANLAAKFAEAFNASGEAKLAGMLHDLGKYGDLFQRRLEGKERGIDHWSGGAWVVLKKYELKGVAAALAIQGHHVGLLKGDEYSLRELEPKKLIERLKRLHMKLSEPDMDLLLQRMRADGLDLPEVSSSIYDYKKAENHPAAMLDVRMLFSALVDADFIETEAHFEAKTADSKHYRTSGPPLEPERAMSDLESHIKKLADQSSSSPQINDLRSDLLEACLKAARAPQGLFTLTAPTGAGKTLSMLAFALKHAQEHELRRIVMVIPYLSIVEQTVQEYRKLFGAENAEHYVLENHSLAGLHKGNDESGKKENGVERLLAQNWDAPIIVTTSVQMLESLFSNRSSACRKLHRLAESVIMFDEVQTMPARLAVPTLATLSHLAERYRVSVVFSTATQPAFGHLDGFVREYCAKGWEPREIVSPELRLFERARRTKVVWPENNRKTSWAELADKIAGQKQALCIVNMKRHALLLHDELRRRGVTGLLHLSTNMCPAHRQVVLDKVRKRLKRREPCLLVSTQCVEAGVDVDFPVVYRAFAPLDAIAQAAGRCNRNGLLETGFVHVFTPEDERQYPDGAYRQAASVTKNLLIERSADRMDIHDPALFEKYYHDLYRLAEPENRNEELKNAMKGRDFVATAQEYRVIEKNAVNVLVPYSHENFEQLKKEARDKGLTRQWIASARPYAVGLFRPKTSDPVISYLEPVRIGKGGSEEWFIYLNEKHYDREKGLMPPSSTECLIA